ncbi:MAG: class I SAM-dependent methyltransferase [Nitriliruptorales bacterium]|nr:class I SAM-dependent methyltransferase [Nitriliruptorales bacterium]
MVGSRAYDLMYRYWAPWDAVGVRTELREFLDDWDVSPRTHPRAIDLGCGTGANVVHLASEGYDAHGVDFSAVAIEKARARAREAQVDATFVIGDLTADDIPGIDGAFDLLVDFGTLDDLASDGRREMAATVVRLSRPGSLFLFWCFYAARQDLPFISFHGPSRLAPAIEPGEERALFGDQFDIEDGPPVDPRIGARCFVMTRRA